MKILVCLLHFGYYRNFESVIRELARRGHHVHIAAEKGDRDRARDTVERLASEYTTVTVGTLPTRESDAYREMAQRIRLGFDYMRYLEPAYRGMPGLRMRSEERVPVGLLRLLSAPGIRTRPGRLLVRSSLRALEQAIPPSPQIEQYLREQRPDALLITPLIGVVSSSQFDYVATAARLGIPTGFGVWSWDNLSSKALVRPIPDCVFVWNETQRREAVDLHRIPAANVVVTGAQCFDRWFGRAPSRSREEFCRHVGLPDDRPYVLYAGSTMVWKSPPEAEFVVRWLRHLRASRHDAVRDAAILIRPHPGRLEEWKHVDVSTFDRVAFSGTAPGGPGVAASVTDDEARADYFDALYYSAAVVGINTSAFIEAGIIGRPVHAILADEFAGTQAGTIHFRYLTEVGGGVAEAGRAFDEHERQLAATLEGRSHHGERQKKFLEAFVRPHGVDVAATPVFADAVESLARMERRAPVAAAPPAMASLFLRLLTRATRRGRGRLQLLTQQEYDAARRKAAAVRVKRKSDRTSVTAEPGVLSTVNDTALPEEAVAAIAPATLPVEPAPSGECIVVSYHYVRDVKTTGFRRLHVLAPEDFTSQLEVLERACEMLRPAALPALLDTRHPPAAPLALLTFDDGLTDHYHTVFPVLRGRGLHGIFFVSPPGPRVLNVQKVQILLATLGGEALLHEVEAMALKHGLASPVNSLQPALYRYDAPADRRVKQLLNYELPYAVADDVLSALFERHVGNEAAVASELYLSEAMIREMSQGGMTIGFHTRDHRVLSRLTLSEQRAQIDGGVEWIRELTGQDAVPFCYPHGHAQAYTAQTVDVVRRAGYSMAFTAVRSRARLDSRFRFDLPRYDTRDVDAALDAAPAAAPAGVAVGKA